MWRRRPRMRRLFGGARVGRLEERTLLTQAHELFSQGQYLQAAEIYERLAPSAPRRAASFYLQAGRARLYAGQAEQSLASFEQGLLMLIERSRWRTARRIGAQIVAEMERLKHLPQAQALGAWLQQRMMGFPQVSAPEAAAPARRPRLALKCPSCGGAVNPEEVEWLDDETVECVYCGNSIRAEGA